HLRRQLHRGLHLHLRHLPRARPRLRRSLPAHGGGAGLPAAGPVRPGARMNAAPPPDSARPLSLPSAPANRAVLGELASLTRWLPIVIVALLALLPFTIGEYFVNLASQVIIAIVFASSLNLLAGYGGLTSLGHAAFLGISAYTSAWLATKLGWGHAATAPIALAVTT